MKLFDYDPPQRIVAADPERPPSMPDAGLFRTAVVDPPWPYKTTDRHGKLSGYVDQARPDGAAHYGTLTIDDMCGLPVGDVVDGYLFMWCTGPFLESGFRLINAWGFQYVTAVQWLKKTRSGKLRYGAGYWYRGSSETILVAKKKNVLSVRTQQRNVFDWEYPGGHSTKPEGLQDHIEEFFPGPYLELFARRTRPGWTCLGNECPGDGMDIRDRLAAMRDSVHTG